MAGRGGLHAQRPNDHGSGSVTFSVRTAVPFEHRTNTERKKRMLEIVRLVQFILNYVHDNADSRANHHNN